MSKPTVFLGSSTEQLKLADRIHSCIKHDASVVKWSTSFTPGETTMDGLTRMANQADFAVFVLGPDDQVESRGEETEAPRDNVVFECGYFGAILGMKRTFLVWDKNVKLPSDLQGLTPLNYDSSEDVEIQGDNVGTDLIRVIQKLGWRGSEGLAGQFAGDWWQYNLGPAEKENNVMGFITIRREAPRIVSLSGVAYADDGKPVARFESRAANLDEGQKRLFYYWEGDWPGQKGVPEFFGTGEITLKDGQNAEGYFTVNSVDDKNMREKIRGSYRRATAEDAMIMKGGSDARLKDLIKVQLENRKQAVFA